jgi:hypothetical protein
MGKRKPNADSFAEIIAKEKLIPSETLFIDDSRQAFSSRTTGHVRSWITIRN